MKKLIYFITILLILISLSSCSNEATLDIVDNVEEITTLDMQKNHSVNSYYIYETKDKNLYLINTDTNLPEFKVSNLSGTLKFILIALLATILIMLLIAIFEI